MSSRIDTSDAAQPVAAYSQAVEAGELVFVSGQIPLTLPQANLSRGHEGGPARCIASPYILQAAGLDLNNVVKASVFDHMDDYAEMDAYREGMRCPFRQGSRGRLGPPKGT